MSVDFKLTDTDRRRIVRIAALIDAEADTWRDGWAVWNGTERVFSGDKEDEWVRVRVFKLESAIAYLRALVRADLLGPSPRVEAAIAAE